jgi:hypothetical protein
MREAFALPGPWLLLGGGSAVSGLMGVIVLALLLVALVAKVLLQSTLRSRRSALRLLDIVITPLLVAFLVVVLMRFRDLS